MANLTLPQMYQALPEATFPKKEFIEKIQRATQDAGTNRSLSTIQKWLRDTNHPTDIRDIKVLSEVTGIPYDQLFG